MYTYILYYTIEKNYSINDSFKPFHHNNKQTNQRSSSSFIEKNILQLDSINQLISTISFIEFKIQIDQSKNSNFNSSIHPFNRSIQSNGSIQSIESIESIESIKTLETPKTPKSPKNTEFPIPPENPQNRGSPGDPQI